MGPSHLKNNFQSRDIYPNSRASSLLKRIRTEKFQIQTKFLKHLSHNSFPSLIFKTLEAMSNPSSPTLDEVIEKIMEDMQRERVEQLENQKTTPAEEVREEVEEVEGDLGGAEKFLTDKGAEIFKKTLANKRIYWREGVQRVGATLKGRN